jgi:hypothetical protein
MISRITNLESRYLESRYPESREDTLTQDKWLVSRRLRKRRFITFFIVIPSRVKWWPQPTHPGVIPWSLVPPHVLSTDFTFPATFSFDFGCLSHHPYSDCRFARQMPHKVPLLFITSHPLSVRLLQRHSSHTGLSRTKHLRFTTKSSGVTASRSFLYLTTSSGQTRHLCVFHRSAHGSLSPTPGLPLSLPFSISTMAVHPSGEFVYAGANQKPDRSA